MASLARLTNAEGVSVGVLDEHFADAPRLVAGRLQDGDALAIARSVNRVHVGHPDRQPHPVFATTALPIATQKDFGIPGSDSAESHHAVVTTPVERLGPAEPSEPADAVRHVRHVQDGRYPLRLQS